MMNTVENTVERLRLGTQSRLDQFQVELAPFLADDFVDIKETEGYMSEGQYTRLTINDDYRSFRIKGLRVMHKSSKKKYSRRGWLKDMVADKVLHPFLLFNEGKVIPWSKIEVLKDYDYTYIFIHGISKRKNVSLSIIEFPCNVRYGEDDDVLPPDECQLGLYFDQYYRLSHSDIIKVRLEVIDNGIYASEKRIDSSTYSFSVDNEFGIHATKRSIIPFKNGLLYPEGLNELQEKGWNIFTNMAADADDYYQYQYLVFTSNRVNKEFSHMYHKSIDAPTNMQRIKDYGRLNNPAYLDELFKLTRFNFTLDPNKNFKQNMSDALDYIVNYNANLLDDAYRRETCVFRDEYTGWELIDRAKANNGIMTVSRKRCGKFDSFVIIFVNGVQYKWTKLIRYDNNDIHIPIRDIEESDQIEFIFFTDACNINNTITVSKGYPVYVYPGYNMEFVSLYSNEKHGLVYDVFDIDENGRTQFEIPFKYSKTDIQNYYLIEFEDEWYYDRTLTITSNRQMRHVVFTYEDVEKEENNSYYFLLPTEFNFCHQKSHYIVMLNGRMLSKQNFTVTETSVNRPFDKLYLYITSELEDGDTLDVYYLPCSTVDSIWIDELDTSGDIVVDTSKIDMPLSADNYFIFVDGYKVDSRNVINIASNRVRIKTAYGSLHNVLFMKYNPDIMEIKQAFAKTNSDEWSRYIDSLLPMNLNKLIGDYTELHGNSADNYMDYMYPLSTIVSDIVFDYYVRRAGLTKKNELFVYDFERDAAGYIGPNTGVVALSATDSNAIDKKYKYVNNLLDDEIEDKEWAKSPVDNDRKEPTDE